MLEQLEMGAKMEYSSYFPGYYSTRNLSLDANGSTWPLSVDAKILESGNYFNGFLSSDCLLAYNKEFLKQTMLKHEAIFKNQVKLSAFGAKYEEHAVLLVFR